MRGVLLAAACLLALAAAGCGGSGSESAQRGTTATATQTEPATTGVTRTETAPGTRTVRIYLLRNDQVAPVARSIEPTPAVARAALTQLVAGPSAQERGDGLATDVPDDTGLRGLAIDGGVATVDFDAAFVRGAEATLARRLAQVVYTLTQFPTVSAVRFEQEGSPLPAVDGNGVPLDRPAKRADYEALTPPILVEAPLPHQTVSSPIETRGTAVAFEATFQLEVVDAAGKVVGRQTVTASEGGPARGTFETTVAVDAAPGEIRLVAYEDNQGNGQRMHVVTVPLRLAP